jgi:hypothetical protein
VFWERWAGPGSGRIGDLGSARSDPVATFSFSSSAQLFTLIGPRRWELIEHLQINWATNRAWPGPFAGQGREALA